MHWKYAEIKSRYLSGAPSVMVELGPGAGANLRYLPRGTRLIAIEPNLKMHALLRRGAKNMESNWTCAALLEKISTCPPSRSILFSVLLYFVLSKIPRG